MQNRLARRSEQLLRGWWILSFNAYSIVRHNSFPAAYPLNRPRNCVTLFRFYERRKRRKSADSQRLRSVILSSHVIIWSVRREPVMRIIAKIMCITLRRRTAKVYVDIIREEKREKRRKNDAHKNPIDEKTGRGWCTRRREEKEECSARVVLPPNCMPDSDCIFHRSVFFSSLSLSSFRSFSFSLPSPFSISPHFSPVFPSYLPARDPWHASPETWRKKRYCATPWSFLVQGHPLSFSSSRLISLGLSRPTTYVWKRHRTECITRWVCNVPFQVDPRNIVAGMSL